MEKQDLKKKTADESKVIFKRLQSAHSISLDNLEEWEQLERSQDNELFYQKPKFHDLKCSLKKFPSKGKKLLFRTKSSKIPIINKPVESSPSYEGLECVRSLTPERASVSAFHSLSPKTTSKFSEATSKSYNSKPENKFFGRSLLSTKSAYTRMSTSMSNISSKCERKIKQSPSSTRFAPSAPTSPSKSLNVTPCNQQHPYHSGSSVTCYDSSSSSPRSSVTCLESSPVSASTPVSETSKKPALNFHALSPIDCTHDTHRWGLHQSLRQDKCAANKSWKTELILPILQIDKPTVVNMTPPRPEITGSRRFASNSCRRSPNLDNRLSPSSALSPRWKLWKQKTCPDLLKTRSSDNLFR